MTVVALPGGGFARGFGLEIPSEIVDHKEVQEAVVIDVQPRSANRPQESVLLVRLIESGFHRDIGECAVAVVVVQPVLMNSANKDILVAIVVIVSNGDAIVETSARQSGLFVNILEVTVAVVLEKSIGVLRRALFHGRDISSIGEIDIQAAVVVVVE